MLHIFGTATYLTSRFLKLNSQMYWFGWWSGWRWLYLLSLDSYLSWNTEPGLFLFPPKRVMIELFFCSFESLLPKRRPLRNSALWRKVGFSVSPCTVHKHLLPEILVCSGLLGDNHKSLGLLMLIIYSQCTLRKDRCRADSGQEKKSEISITYMITLNYSQS